MTSGFDCCIAIAPIDAVTWSSNMGLHFIPPLSDFHKPPDAVPTYIMSGLLLTTSIAVTLPLIPPGPIFLGFIFSIIEVEKFWPFTTVPKKTIKRR